MRHYEIVVVFDPRLNEEQLNKEIDGVKKVLETNGAVDIEVDKWGRREMTFVAKRKKRDAGVYVCFLFSSEKSGVVDAVNHTLRIADQIVLFQTHRLDVPERKFKGRPQRGDDAESAASL